MLTVLLYTQLLHIHILHIFITEIDNYAEQIYYIIGLYTIFM